MLDDELPGLNELLADIARLIRLQVPVSSGKATRLDRSLQQTCARARRNWTLVLFSERGADAIKRYVAYHQQVLSVAMDRLQELSAEAAMQKGLAALTVSCQQQLTDLLAYLTTTFYDFLDLHLPAPLCFHLQLIGQWHASWIKGREKLQSEQDTGLRDFLTGFIDQFQVVQPGRRHSYGTLFYIRRLISGLESLTADPAVLPGQTAADILTELNFNHLYFFHWNQQYIRSMTGSLESSQKLVLYQQQRSKLMWQPDHPVWTYDPAWPTLRHMLLTWLEEELAQIRALAVQPAEESVFKLPVQLPVAYLACIIKLIYQGAWSREITLTEIFKFTAAHFQSKRMAEISSKSLSKEYYTVSQKTAAMVRELLQELIARINRQYFPVWVVISATVLFH